MFILCMSKFFFFMLPYFRSVTDLATYLQIQTPLFLFSSRDATFSGGGVSCGEITTSVIINSKLKRLSKVVTFCKVMTFRLVKHVSYLIEQIHVFVKTSQE